MRAALWLIGLFALAVAGAWLADHNEGVVAIFLNPYRIDLSLNLFVLALLAVVFVLLGVASAIEMAWLANPETDGSRVYYGTDTRLQSLVLGAALAAVLTPGALERFHVPARVIGPLAAAGIIGLILVGSDQASWLYHGGFLAFASLSVALQALRRLAVAER